MNEDKDKRLKYVEMPKVFYRSAQDIRISSRQHLVTCQKLAKHLASKKPANAKEFEQTEWLKEFVVKSADLNEKVLAFLESTHTLLTEVSEDAKTLVDGAKIRDLVDMQSSEITRLMGIRDSLVEQFKARA